MKLSTHSKVVSEIPHDKGVRCNKYWAKNGVYCLGCIGGCTTGVVIDVSIEMHIPALCLIG